MISKDKVVALFEDRFDYQSARIVLADVSARIGAGKGGFEADEIRNVPAALAALGYSKVDTLCAGLMALADAAAGGKGQKAAPAPEPEEEAEEAPAEEAEDTGKGKKGKKR